MAPVFYYLLVSLTTCSLLGSSWARIRLAPYYKEVYPEVDLDGDLSSHIFFALIQSFGATFNSSGNIAGIKVALDRINNDSSVLPNHVLHYTLTDSQCEGSVAVEALFKQLLIDDSISKVALLGSGCSGATETTADLSHYFNITQISCSSTSTELTDQNRFRHHFQLAQTMVDISGIYKGLINHYQWEYVSLITQNENLFTVAMEDLKQHLTEIGIGYSEKLFASNTGLEGVQEIIDPVARIFIVASYETHAKAFLCEAYRRGLHYPQYLLILMGWYEGKWWLRQTEEEGLNCTGKQRESILEHALTVHHFNLYVPDEIQTTSGITGSEFKMEEEIKRRSPPEYIRGQFSPYCYDAVWTLAYALNDTLQVYSSSDISYKNNRLHNRLLRYVTESNFTGITGSVRFNSEGVRGTDNRQVFQLRHQSGGDTLDIVQVGEVVERDGEFQFDIFPSFSEETLWPAGLPRDGTPVNTTVTIHLGTTIVFVSLASAAMVFTVVCLIFNFYFREKKLIKLSSPNLNYLIGTGAIILYIATFLLVTPSKDPLTVSALCTSINWLLSIGFSLCYGTIICKMIRIHYIFKNPVPQPRATLKDWKLAIGVLVMVVVDLIFLIPLTIIEWVNGYEPELKLYKENPSCIDEVFGTVEYHYAVRCGQSPARSPFLPILYGYKALLQLVAIVLAFTTRKVKVKGVNDSKYVTVMICITSVILAVCFVSTFVLSDYVNLIASLFGLGLTLGTTAVVALLFVPKMIMLYKDPEGKHIFKSSPSNGGASADVGAELSVLRRRVVQLEQTLDNMKTEDNDQRAIDNE